MNLTLKLAKSAVSSLVKNRMRSLLTSLGIIIGVSAFIVMVSIGTGTQTQVEERINSLGTNLLMVMPGSTNSRGVRGGMGSGEGFTFDEIEKLQDESLYLSAVSPVARSGAQVIYEGLNWNCSIYGVGIDYLTIKDWDVDQGEFFTEKDIKSKRKVAVLGQIVVDELFDGVDPIGTEIRIRNIPFTVVGTLKSKGQAGVGQDQDDVVLAPVTTVLYRLKGGDKIDMIMASASSVEVMDPAEEEIGTILREARGIGNGEDDDFHIMSQTEITEAVTGVTQTLTILLGSIAAVSLIVGGIGIMNIMLVSVTERTREIGIRLSVGARPSDILIQFLTEALVLSLSGGIIGILISFASVYVMNNLAGMYAVISAQIVAISVLFSAVVGIFFGFYPARKASALNPIDALRYE